MGSFTQEPFSVTELTTYIRRLFEEDESLSRVQVRGEVSNFRRHYSGHCYFTLKDAGAALRCVMFRSRAATLKFEPNDGILVRVKGHVSVYERDGSYQLYVDSMITDGLGDLNAAFNRLREKLKAEGLFDESRKQGLPKMPQRVGVVTSPTGAALRDIVSVMRRRNPFIPILVFPAQVQGTEAPDQIARAIKMLDESGRVDVIIIGRGGGSLEELWAFNDERVVRAVAAAKTPVVSAVGHQTDFTLSDFVADVRAATPSQAAELVTPEVSDLLRRLDAARQRLRQAFRHRIAERRLRLERCLSSRLFRRPQEMLREKEQALDQGRQRLSVAMLRLFDRKRQQWQMSVEKLNALNPLMVLQRGYSVVRLGNGQVLRRINDVAVADELEVLLQDGSLLATVTQVKKVEPI